MLNAISQLCVRKIQPSGAFSLCDMEGRTIGAQTQIEIKQWVHEENGCLSRVTVEFILKTENITSDEVTG